jgi:HEAT repeat protein
MMRRLALVVVLLSIQCGWLAAHASAHGGGFPPPPPAPPTSTVGKGNPGGGGGPGNPNGGRTTGGPGTPGNPTGPRTGGGGGGPKGPTDPTDPPPTPPVDPPSPGTGPSTTPPGTSGPQGPATPTTPMQPPTTTPSGPKAPPPGGRTGGGGAPGLGRRTTNDSDRWEHWWSEQRELYLTRLHGASLLPRTGGGAHESITVDLRRSLLPLFASALRDASPDVADSAAIALGRCVRSEDAGPVVPVFMRTLAHPDRAVRDAAVLGLGILGGSDAIRPLTSIALDSEEGRTLCGVTGPLDTFLRSQAVLALGLTRSNEAIAPIMKIVSAPETPRELASAAVLALGLAHDAAPAVTVTLVKLLEDRALDREVRAQVPIALARLPGTSARAAMPRLVQMLSDRQTPDFVARSAAIALGRIAGAEDGEIVDVLCNAAAHDEDAGTRQFALLALGRLYEHSKSGDETAQKRKATAQTFLVDALRKPTHKQLKPYAALALGLFARGDPPREGGAPSPLLAALHKSLSEAFDEEADPSVQGAIAIALGLSGATSATPSLRKQLAQSSNPTLRGHVSLALGMLGDRESATALRKLVSDSSLPPSARIDVARALAMVGDASFEDQLIVLLRQSCDTPSAIAYSKALGLVGSEKAAQTLTALSQDHAAPTLQRAFAVVSLGLMAEKTALPWNVPYLVDSNYTVPLRPMEEIADIL